MKKKKLINKNVLLLTGVVVLFAVVYYMLMNGMLTRQISNMLVSICIYIVLAVSLNIIVGFLGELSLGHAAFMSVGAFAGSLFSIAFKDTLPIIARLPLAMVIGGAIAAGFGFIVGLPALRLKGDYLAIVTLACCEIIKSVITNLDFTGGALGLDTSKLYQGPKVLLPYVFVLVFLTILVSINIKDSKQGRAIMAIRDNGIAAESIGINITKFKLMVFVLAAFFAGAAGAVQGYNVALLQASTFDYNMSIEILVIVVLGGMGNITGSIISAIVLRVLPEMLRGIGDFRMIAYALVLIIVMIFSNNEKILTFKYKTIGRLKKKIRNAKKAKEVENNGK